MSMIPIPGLEERLHRNGWDVDYNPLTAIQMTCLVWGLGDVIHQRNDHGDYITTDARDLYKVKHSYRLPLRIKVAQKAKRRVAGPMSNLCRSKSAPCCVGYLISTDLYGSVLVSWCAKKSAYPNCSGALTNCSGRLITVPEDYNCYGRLITATEDL